MTEHSNERPDEQAQGGHVAEEPSYTYDAPGAAEEAAHASEERHDTVDGPEQQRRSTDQLGENLRKAAEDTAYAAVGFVGLMADKAKEFYEDQKKQYAESHPDADSEQGTKNFLAQLREQLDRFIDDVNRGFRDLADRGRASGKDQGTKDAADPTNENDDYNL